jgi:hypothetical protein
MGQSFGVSVMRRETHLYHSDVNHHSCCVMPAGPLDIDAARLYSTTNSKDGLGGCAYWTSSKQSQYDRAIIRGQIPGFSYAKGMERFLDSRHAKYTAPQVRTHSSPSPANEVSGA